MKCTTLSEEEVNEINRDNNRYAKYSRLLNSLGIILNTLGSIVILAYTLATFHKKPPNDIMYQQALLEVSVILIVIGCILALVSIVVSSKVKVDVIHPSDETNTLKSLFSGRSRRRSVGTNMSIRSSDGITSERDTIQSLFSGGHRRSVGTNYTTTSDGPRRSLGPNYSITSDGPRRSMGPNYNTTLDGPRESMGTNDTTASGVVD